MSVSDKKVGMYSVKELYRIGRGPSSSHTMGPANACRRVLEEYPNSDRFKVILYGSLAKTGKGHRTDYAIKKTFDSIPVDIVFDSDTDKLPHPNTLDICALKFYSSVRMEVRRVESIKSDGGMVGNHTKVKVVKNKVAPPFKEAEFDIIYGEGISKEGNILDVAVDFDIINKSGSWFSYNGERLGQGREGVKKILKDNPELCREIELKVREAADLPVPHDDEETEATPFTPVSKPAKPKKSKSE